MPHSNRYLLLGTALIATTFGAIAVVACGADSTPIPSTVDDAGASTQPTTDGQAGSSPSDGGGSSSGGDAADAADAEAPLPPGVACSTNAHCRGGQCVGGACICDLLLIIQPDGRCGTVEETTCDGQADAGAYCIQGPGECDVDGGILPSSDKTDRTCGDLLPAACCFRGCRGPAALGCCGEEKSFNPPICVHGWKTCRPNQLGALKASDCP